MKLRDFVRHLEVNNCQLVREGGNHSVYMNVISRKISTVPRHRELDEYLCRKICRDLEIPAP